MLAAQEMPVACAPANGEPPAARCLSGRANFNMNQPIAPPLRGSIETLLAPLQTLAQRSPRLRGGRCGDFVAGGERYTLPRYVFTGPGGAEGLRVGVFAMLASDEAESAYAAIEFVQQLVATPEAARGYTIYLYPLCNPTGFEDQTAVSRDGRQLDREFWVESAAPEIFLLEQELHNVLFHGLVSLHSATDCQGVYGFARTEGQRHDLLEPALWAAERHLPRDRRWRIGGYSAVNGAVVGPRRGALAGPPGRTPAPFELALVTPREAPLHRQVAAHVAALLCLLAEYRTIQTIAQHI